MSIKAEYKKHDLIFNFPAKTSRGAITIKPTYFLYLYDTENTEVKGIGECSYLKGLSIDDREDYEDILTEYCRKINKGETLITILSDPELENLPSIRFGLEMAVKDLESGGNKSFFANDFRWKEERIPINGLVWMGDKDFMFEQLKGKLDKGFSCIKIKIGAIDFKEECELLGYIRSQFSAKDVVLRVDANGAFSKEEALEKLKILSEFDIHSIEQPIRAGQWEAMAQLCEQTPLPIALDEELIGIKSVDKLSLLKTIKPQHIILKPSLVGGFDASNEWIKLAESQKIGWWMTSALEANIGLNAISQLASLHKVNIPQGLGTGQLYHNNIDSPLSIENGQIYYDLDKGWKM